MRTRRQNEIAGARTAQHVESIRYEQQVIDGDNDYARFCHPRVDGQEAMIREHRNNGVR